MLLLNIDFEVNKSNLEWNKGNKRGAEAVHRKTLRALTNYTDVYKRQIFIYTDGSTI